MQHLLSVPSSTSPPVLCFLHGYGEAAPLPLDRALTLHGPHRPDTPAFVQEQFLIVAPQLPVGGDLWHRYASEVRNLVERLIETHRADAQRVYLTGFSFGGNGVFDLALLQPGFWRALWPVDPTRVPASDPRLPIWLSFGEVARYRKGDYIGFLDLKPPEQAPEGDRVYVDKGDDHVASARRAYRDERIYSWLLSR